MKYIGTKMSDGMILNAIVVALIALLGTWVCSLINNK